MPIFDGIYYAIYGIALSVRPSVCKLVLVRLVTFKVLGLESSYHATMFILE